MAHRKRPLLGLLFALVATALAFAAAGVAAPNNNNSAKLRAAVGPTGLFQHLNAFQAIADANGSTRVAGSAGYDASAAYVFNQLAAAGYNVRFQEFTFETFQQIAPSRLEQVEPNQVSYVRGQDFAIMTYSGSGDVTASVTAVDIVLAPPRAPVTSGCEGAFVENASGAIVPNTTGVNDFAGFPAGDIALMQRGTCTFDLKVRNAQAAGAVGAIIFNQGNTEGRSGVLSGTLGATSPSTIPAVGMTFALGETLAGLIDDGLVMHLVTSTFRGQRTTRNVIADSTSGRTDNVVVVGAHLDSVDEGPGINDNGSGIATILEIARQMSKVNPRNQVRFAFWSAEESGLIGSRHYVQSLSEAERSNIALYLNFDMVGSPNYVRFVYDGDNSAFPVSGGAQAGPPGSGMIEKVFVDYFAAQGLASEPTEFNGRSDYGPFIAVGIPSGGLFTGAEGTKTAEQAAVYGGTAGVAYDRCYHAACDTIANVNRTGIDQMSDAAAHTVITFAQSTVLVNGERGKGNFNTLEQINRQAAR